MGTVTVEFFGITRQRAGMAELAVTAGTVSELLQRVEQACPTLSEDRRNERREQTRSQNLRFEQARSFRRNAALFYQE